jgi:peptidoglycan/xylan/chitin deacetylase (PgdA/CDA1 family)
VSFRPLAFLVASAWTIALAGCSSGSPEPTPLPTLPGETPSPTSAETSSPATDTPTSTPSPTATLEPAKATPTRPSGGPSILVEHGSRDSGQVALTFDMGGRVEPALEIMNFLLANEVQATIFMTGAMAENQNTEAGREVLRTVAAHPDLFVLGNHSYTHRRFPELSDAEIGEELETTDAAIEALIGERPGPWFRPPEGAYDARVLELVGAAGYRYTIMWDVDTIDWRPEAEGGPTAADIVEKVLANTQGGTIVLMHLGGYNTFAALPEIVSGLRDRGFELVTVDAFTGD